MGTRLSWRAVIEQGKDAEKWAGHYGARFRGEQLSVSSFNKKKRWINKINFKGVPFGSNFHSYCSTGYGDCFFNQGRKGKQAKYDYLLDEDIQHWHILNEPQSYDFHYKDGFIGGSCLKVYTSPFRLLKVVGGGEPCQYFLSICIKHGKVKRVYGSTKSAQYDGDMQLTEYSREDINGWTRHTFKCIATSDAIRIIHLDAEPRGYLLGEIRLFQPQLPQLPPITCSITVSKQYLPWTHSYLNIEIISCLNRRVLLSIGEANCFCYIENGQGTNGQGRKGRLCNVQVDKFQEVKIQVKDIESNLRSRIILEYTIQKEELRQLLISGSLIIK